MGSHLETHTYTLWVIGAVRGGDSKAMIKGEKRQKEQHLFNSMYALVCRCPSLYWIQSYKKCLLFQVTIIHPKQRFNASNTDSEPTSHHQPSPTLTQSVAYIIVHLCIYITLPHQLFRSCCVGAVDLRQSKALLTSDSLTHTLALTHTRHDLPTGL